MSVILSADEGEMFFDTYIDIFPAAKLLRSRMTVAELLLWDQLKSRKLGCRFKPQHPVLHYVADFYCHPLKLVVEVDGQIHIYQKEKDQDRIRNMEDAGIKVIRFTNEQVVCKMENVLNEIRKVIDEKRL